MTTKKTKLQAIEGGRAALELEALLNLPKDFEKFLEIARSLAPAANGQLQLVDKSADEIQKPETNQ
jgi:hypothetical protein